MKVLGLENKEELLDIAHRAAINLKKNKPFDRVKESRLVDAYKGLIEKTINNGYVISDADGSYAIILDYCFERVKQDMKHNTILVELFSFDDSTSTLVKNERKFAHSVACADSMNTFLVLAYEGNLDKLIHSFKESFPDFNFVVASTKDEEFKYVDFKSPLKKYLFSYYRYIRFNELATVFDDDRIPIISIFLPTSFCKEYPFFLKDNPEIVTIKGFKDTNCPYFASNIFGETEAYKVSLSFDEFRILEKSLNIIDVVEALKDGDEEDETIFIFINRTSNLAFRKKTIDFLTSKNIDPESEEGYIKTQTMAVADILTLIPMKYSTPSEIFNVQVRENNMLANNIITGLIFQENFELGNSNQTEKKAKDRIRRYNLGRIRIVLEEEYHYNYFKKERHEPIGDSFEALLILTIDLETHASVLYICNFALNFPPTKYLDSISRNEVSVVIPKFEYEMFENIDEVYISDSGEQSINLYTYLEIKFKINKRGVPRNYVLSPSSRDELLKYNDLILSILYAENQFMPGEELGMLIDNKLKERILTDWGDALYNYSARQITPSTILDYARTYRDYTYERIDFEVVVLYYMELVVLEDANIQIANYEISKFINEYESHPNFVSKLKDLIGNRPQQVLEKIDQIQQEYAKSMDFWHIRMNYTSSNKILTSIRDAFKIEDNLKLLKRNRDEIQQIYKSKNAQGANTRGILLSLAGILLTSLNVYTAITTENTNKRIAAIIMIVIIVFIFLTNQSISEVTKRNIGKK